jgi:hypothetical protein
MKLINSKIHGIIDYLVVVFRLLSPTVFGLTPLAGTLTYILAGIHLLMTILTDFPYGILKIIPYKIHGLIEFLVSILLVALPWIFHFDADTIDRHFYILFGAAVFMTWLLTDYQHKKV